MSDVFFLAPMKYNIGISNVPFFGAQMSLLSLKCPAHFVQMFITYLQFIFESFYHSVVLYFGVFVMMANKYQIGIVIFYLEGQYLTPLNFSLKGTVKFTASFEIVSFQYD